MNHIRDQIRLEIEKASQALPPELANKLWPVLLANLDRERVENFAGADPARTGEYVQRVREYYEQLHNYLYAVQNERSRLVWEPLMDKLQTWAYNFLLRKNFYPGRETRDVAQECAAEAAIMILNAHFPYDTEFEPWAYTIVTMACLHFFRKETKKSRVPENQLVELDETLPDLSTFLQNGNATDDLLPAISQLVEARRQVIHLHYFAGFSLPEIAERMGKSPGAIYSLHFNALADLRKILSQNRNIP